MELNLERPRDYLFVRRADARSVSIVDRPFTASIILTRDKVMDDWGIRDVAAMTPAHAEPILALQPEIVLLGTGARQQFPSQEVLAAFLQRHVGVEVMDNRSEERRVGKECRTRVSR